MKIALLSCALCLVAASSASAAPAWLAPTDLSAPGRDATNPVVAVNASGDTVAAWERQSTTGPSHIVQLSTRYPGGTFTAPETIAEAATRPAVAIAGSGEAVLAWWRFVLEPEVEKGVQTSHYALEVATRPAGGATFSAPVAVVALPPSVIPGEAQLAANAAGAVVLAWPDRDPASKLLKPLPNFIQASVRPPGGSFSAPETVSPVPSKEGQAAHIGGVAVDGAGEATVVWDYEDEERSVVEAASRPVGGPFAAPVQVNGPLAAEENTFSPEVAADQAGEVTVVWQQNSPTVNTIEAANRVGAEFSNPVQLSEAGDAAFQPQIVTGSAGQATVIWELSETSNLVLQGVTRPDAASAFSAPVDLSPEEGQVSAPRLAASASGEAVIAWSGTGALEQVVLASFRAPGGGFSAPAEISATSPDNMRPAVSIDGSGDATVLWPRSNGSNSIVQFAGYDAFVPQLRGLSIPSAGTVGSPVAFSVSPFDVWPIGAASFEFGDGARANGNSLTHTYTAPGTYLVKASATDPAGTLTSAQGTIAIVPSNKFSLGKLKLNKKRGTGRLTVSVPWSGKLVLSGKGVKKAALRAKKAGNATLSIATLGKARKRLDQKGDLKVKVSVSFTPDGGSTAVRKKTVKLIEKHG